jgi:hypothetical protein
MLTPLELAYPNSEPYEVVLLDDRIPGIAERLHRERAAWRADADVEMLGLDHAVLPFKPGGVQRNVA